MNARRISLLVIGVLTLALLLSPSVSEARKFRTIDRSSLLTGELVVTNPARNQFRLVGHSGIFTAPAGMSVEAFSGKPVQVEIGREGRVVEISELPIHIEPIAHDFDIISGQLVVRDPLMRTFTIAGDRRIYVAPAGVDLSGYSGRMVEVQVSEQGTVTGLYPITRSGDVPLVRGCSFSGQYYSDGASACQSGTQYRCDAGVWRNLGIVCDVLGPTSSCDVDGMSYSAGASLCQHGRQFICDRGFWRDLGTACTVGGATAFRSMHSCMVGGASVANGSSICRSGTTFRCTDGEWVNVGSACS